MNKQSLLIITSVLFMILSSGLFGFINQDTPNNLIFTENHEDNLLVFRNNAEGKTIEGILIQGTDLVLANVSDFTISQDGRSASILTGGTSLNFSIDNNGATQVYGITRYNALSSEGIDSDTILEDVQNLGRGGSSKKDCDQHCKAGGCGSNGCERSIGPVSCNVSCSSGYFACCGDFVMDSCKCVKDDCCSATPVGPTIKPGY
ncbi:MAG: hypothetical protein AAF502_21930 [Bacteroidota bacterium]